MAAGRNDGLRIESLSVAYAGARQAPPVLALSGVDLHIAPGELVVALGAMAYRTVPRLEDPEFIIRTALVTAYFPGAGPDKVEELITHKLESKIQEMPEVSKLESQSMTGVSLVAGSVAGLPQAAKMPTSIRIASNSTVSLFMFAPPKI